MDAYTDFAYVYDRLMRDDIDYGRWCDYIEALFGRHCRTMPKTICELACGTGNITAAMENRGYSMCGVDSSSDMLAVASGKIARSPLLCIDMTQFTPQKSYDAFLCMIDGINYVIAPEALLNMFKTIKTHLNDGGAFIFDISTRYKLEHILGNETFIFSEPDLFYSWQNRYLTKRHLSDMLLNFFVLEGESYYRFEERHLQRGYSEREMRGLLKKAGFSDIRVYDELSFGVPHSRTQRMVFVCLP